ncbi:hypothetical protein ACFUIT_18530 [Streptomyces sp. NPDC057239]|uniref:hypothetical protein n=1 Tax=Streptomyces sp. NPDC057239 TaxID=3346061 RepID=UPI0036418F0F
MGDFGVRHALADEEEDLLPARVRTLRRSRSGDAGGGGGTYAFGEAADQGSGGGGQEGLAAGDDAYRVDQFGRWGVLLPCTSLPHVFVEVDRASMAFGKLTAKLTAYDEYRTNVWKSTGKQEWLTRYPRTEGVFPPVLFVFDGAGTTALDNRITVLLAAVHQLASVHAGKLTVAATTLAKPDHHGPRAKIWRYPLPATRYPLPRQAGHLGIWAPGHPQPPGPPRDGEADRPFKTAQPDQVPSSRSPAAGQASTQAGPAGPARLSMTAGKPTG